MGKHASRFRQRNNDDRGITPAVVENLRDCGAMLHSVFRAAGGLELDAAAVDFLRAGEGFAYALDAAACFRQMLEEALVFDAAKPVTIGMVRRKLAESKDRMHEKLREVFPKDALDVQFGGKGDAIYAGLEKLYDHLCTRVEYKAEIPVQVATRG